LGWRRGRQRLVTVPRSHPRDEALGAFRVDQWGIPAEDDGIARGATHEVEPPWLGSVDSSLEQPRRLTGQGFVPLDSMHCDARRSLARPRDPAWRSWVARLELKRELRHEGARSLEARFDAPRVESPVQLEDENAMVAPEPTRSHLAIVHPMK